MIPPSPITTGLSPRVRGSPCANVHVDIRIGSIPAGAGEPLPPAGKSWEHGVYPRGCGGAHPLNLMPMKSSGLSPRVRGSPSDDTTITYNDRSIPAGAGEPLRQRTCRYKNRVYPRGCGGAHRMIPPSPITTGLSPRVRGSPSERRHAP